MKQKILIALAIALLPLHSMAQDDMYFVPTKKNKKKAREEYLSTIYANYSKDTRSVDEYNRRGSQVSTVQLVDSTGNDIIVFDAVTGVYPDSVVAEMYRTDSLMSAATDYQYTKQLSRFDDYQWRQAYNEGYSDGRYDSWGGSWYYDPWYWNSWYYDPWYYGRWGYAGWDYGWHYNWHYAWHRPHYHHHWHRPNYGHRPPSNNVGRPHRVVTGTRNQGTFRNNRSNGSFSNNKGSFSNNRGSFSSGSTRSSSSFRSGSSGGSRSGSFGVGSRGGSSSRGGGGSFGGRR